jgi:hypothetical protein
MTMTDSSGHNNDLTVNWLGAGRWSTQSPFDGSGTVDPNDPNSWLPAKNNSWYFGPTEIFSAAGTDPNVFNFTGAFTVEFWVKFVDHWAGNPYLISKRNTSGSPSGWWIEFYPGATFFFYVNKNGIYQSTSATLGQGAYAGIYNGTVANGGTGEMFLYINGISNGGNGCSGLTGNTAKLSVGYNLPGSGNYLKGWMDEIRIHNLALPADLLGWNGSVVDAADCQEALAYDFGFVSDLSGDCKIDFKDFAKFSADWLKQGLTPADFDSSGKVNVTDLAEFANDWLRCMDPTIDSCEHSWRWW